MMVGAVEVSFAQGRRLVNQLKAMASLDPIPSVPCVSGDKLAIRVLSPPEATQNIQELGIPAEGVERISLWINATDSMFLVEGPTGCG